MKLPKQLMNDVLMFDGINIRIRPKYKQCILNSANRTVFGKATDATIRETPEGIELDSPSSTYLYYRILSDVAVPPKSAPLEDRQAYFRMFKDRAILKVVTKGLDGRNLHALTLDSYKNKFYRILNTCVYQDDISNLMQTEKNPLSKLPAEFVQNVGSFLTGEIGPVVVQKTKMNIKKGYTGVKAGKRKTRRKKKLAS